MRVRAWVDGGARGNPGPAGYGALFRAEGGAELLRVWGFIGSTTNNVAEYRGLIAALELGQELGATELEIRTDSELIQRQVTGVYRVKQPHLQDLMAEVKRRIRNYAKFEILHVRREDNRDADALANLAMDTRASGREPAT